MWASGTVHRVMDKIRNIQSFWRLMNCKNKKEKMLENCQAVCISHTPSVTSRCVWMINLGVLQGQSPSKSKCPPCSHYHREHRWHQKLREFGYVEHSAARRHVYDRCWLLLQPFTPPVIFHDHHPGDLERHTEHLSAFLWVFLCMACDRRRLP